MIRMPHREIQCRAGLWHALAQKERRRAFRLECSPPIVVRKKRRARRRLLRPASSPFALVEIPSQVRHLLSRIALKEEESGPPTGAHLRRFRYSVIISTAYGVSDDSRLRRGGDNRWMLKSIASFIQDSNVSRRLPAEYVDSPKELSGCSSVDTVSGASQDGCVNPSVIRTDQYRRKKAGETQVAQTCVITLRLGRDPFTSEADVATSPGGGGTKDSGGRSSPSVRKQRYNLYREDLEDTRLDEAIKLATGAQSYRSRRLSRSSDSYIPR